MECEKMLVEKIVEHEKILVEEEWKMIEKH